MEKYQVWVTKISYAQVMVEIEAENENDAMDKGVNHAVTFSDFTETHKTEYEVNYVNKID